MLADQVRTVDIVVAGGAMTGLWAGIRAKQLAPEKSVLVVDKATAGRSGCVAFAGGDITCVLPEDNFPALVQRYLLSGDGLAEQDWLETLLQESADRVMDMESWGVPFERQPDGRLLRKAGRGGGALSVVMPGWQLIRKLRQAAFQRGVSFLDRTMVVSLVDNGSRNAGVLALDVETGETILIQAGATVLVPGPCGFKATYIGHRMVTGDGIAAAYRDGAAVVGMEFAVGHNTGPRDFDISGLARFVAMGGKFLNSLGEEFLHRYDPVLGNKANWSTLARSMAMEVRAGRGPIYFDMTSIDQNDFALSRKILPHTFKTLDRVQMDFRKDRIEWIPCFQGNISAGAGLRIDRSYSTTLPGVFTGGDTGHKPWYGAEAGYHGMNLAWCAVSGYHAAEGAVRWAEEHGLATPRAEQVEQKVHYIVAPQNKRGIGPDEAIERLQQIIIPYEVIILKEQARLGKAIEALASLSDEVENELSAPDPHELVKANEVRSMLAIGEMILKASLVRTESRGTHYREDHPQRDDVHWRRFLYLRRAAGQRMEFWTEEAGRKNAVGVI